MRLREADLPLDPEVERRLDAIDDALAGRRVDPDLEDLALLAVEIRSARTGPSAEAEQMLDALAEDGFPPRVSDRAGRASRRLADALGAFRAASPRRIVPALAAVTVLLVAVGVGVSQSGVLGGDRGNPVLETAQGPAETGGDRASARSHVTNGSAPSASTGFTEAGKGPDAADQSTQHLPRALGTGRGPLVAGSLSEPNRKVARNVDLTLSTTSGEFRDAADGVLDVVRDHRGFVLTSHVSSGDPDAKGAQRGQALFDLRIPATELSAALGDLSDLGHVVSRTDGTQDITKRFVSTRDRIEALTATRDRLLRELGAAATTEEQASLRARLRIAEAQLASAHRDLDRARQRVNEVPVSVTIDADGRQASGGAWTIGDAFHDAGRVLTVAAGVALVAGAALLPLALLIALVVAAWRGWVHRERSRALDAETG